MSIDALIAGRVHGAPKARTSNSGTRYATAVVRTSTRDGGAIYVNVIAFADTTVAALLALSDGDSIALSGELTPKVYIPKQGEPRPSLDLLAHAALTPFSVSRKRRSIARSRSEHGELPLDADLPGAA